MKAEVMKEFDSISGQRIGVWFDMIRSKREQGKLGSVSRSGVCVWMSVLVLLRYLLNDLFNLQNSHSPSQLFTLKVSTLGHHKMSIAVRCPPASTSFYFAFALNSSR